MRIVQRNPKKTTGRSMASRLVVWKNCFAILNPSISRFYALMFPAQTSSAAQNPARLPSRPIRFFQSGDLRLSDLPRCYFSKCWLKPARNWFCQKRPSSVLKNRRQTEWRSQIVVVKDENARKLSHRLFEIGHGARKPGSQFFGRHIVSALADAHGNAFFGTVGIGYANEAHHCSVTLLRRLFQKRQLVTHRIGKYRLENKTFLLAHKFLPQFGSDFSCLVSINSEFSGQNIRIEKSQSAGFQVHFVKGGLALSVQSGQGDNHPSLVQFRNL